MDYIFITGMGRSGTTFLAKLFSKSTNTIAKHEYIGGTEYWLLSWYLKTEEYTIPFLKKEKNKIEKKYAGSSKQFIDVNGYLQHSTLALKSVFNESPVFHLVRDPRLTIPSIYIRRHNNNPPIIPKTKLEIEQWLDADKFYKVCWNWADTTRNLLNSDTILLKFEKIINDYNYLQENLLEPYNIELTERLWDEAKDNKVNKTRSKLYRYLYSKYKGKPFVKDATIPYKNWTPRQLDIFKETCGDLVKELGYI